MRKTSLTCLCVVLWCSSLFAQPAKPEAKLVLKDGWSLQSSANVGQPGSEISSPGFAPKGWYSVSIPTTVVAALVKAKIYPDPLYGMNLRSLPGVTYPIGGNFSNFPMQSDSPFAVPWWYRKEFNLPADYQGKTIWLKFNGINYRASIWLNGKLIAGEEQVAGAWRTYEFDITKEALPGKANVLAVETWAPTETDLAITFVDWNPAPPDKNMGLWRSVEVSTSGPVSLRYPAVVSKVDSPENAQAHLTVTALLKNASDHAVKGTLKAEMEKIQLSQQVELGAGESKDVVFDPSAYPQLNLPNPRLWWPAQMGKPELYDLKMQFEIGGQVSDRSQIKFGIREIESELSAPDRRLVTVNGKKILIRGGGWSPDMMLREDSQRLQDELRYVADMGLNTVRLEGKLETQEFFDIADRDGILVMAGWCCCDHWEHWGSWKPQDFEIAKASLRDQMYRLRSHPSLVMWMNGSDNPPPPDVEQMYLDIEKQMLWPNPVVSSATAKTAAVTGDSGVKMTGPYEYVAPSYWLKDIPGDKHDCNPGGCGGAYGFNSETSPGPAVPPIESLRMMLPKEHLWPIDEVWNFHAGGGEFKDIHVFTDALNARYGTATGVEDYAVKAQMLGYEGIRAMYEAYSRNKYTSTGVVQWMLNNAWPSMIWHLYDYYLRPGGTYFGAKKAMEPLHPIYGYDDHSIWVVSSQYVDAKGLKLSVKVLNLDMSEKFSQEINLDAPADSTQKVLALPQISDLSPTHFLVLRLQDASGKLVGSNFYWLSAKAETLAWDKSNWWTTPTENYADYTAISQLPKVTLKVDSHTEYKGADAVTRISVENPSRNLAFFVRFKVNRDREEILPVLWQDNYISLLPGEKRELTATYRASELKGTKPIIEFTGWNVPDGSFVMPRTVR
ncbi:MAG TPA: beta galactosidase jelly roll domain-containing protein [Terriglobales bacterium]|nr:beta galactosidase jelly roll domain-containing protein [Terriglobales bacterium]